MSSGKTNQMKDNPLLGLLYALPLDLKVKIFQMAIQSHMATWSMDHKGNFQESLALLNSTLNFGYTELKGDHRDGFWVWHERVLYPDHPDHHDHHDHRGNEGHKVNEDYEDEWFHVHSTLCNKVDRYEEIYLPHHFNNHLFWKREWRDKPDYYWYCEDCRCAKCDLVQDAKLRYDTCKKIQRSKVVRERCTRILEGMSVNFAATIPQRFMVERAMELVDDHYLNDPE